MSDSTLLLVVSLVGSILIAVLFAAWLTERNRRDQLVRRIREAARDQDHALLCAIAEGTAHPLAAWRMGAAMSQSDFADRLDVSLDELAALENCEQKRIDTAKITAVLAAHSALALSVHGDAKTSGFGTSIASDGTPTSGSSDSASVGSVSDGGIASGG